MKPAGEVIVKSGCQIRQKSRRVYLTPAGARAVRSVSIDSWSKQLSVTVSCAMSRIIHVRLPSDARGPAHFAGGKSQVETRCGMRAAYRVRPYAFWLRPLAIIRMDGPTQAL